jgi:hypothetical protein
VTIVGGLIAESLRVGSVLDGVPLTVTRVSRADVGDFEAVGAENSSGPVQQAFRVGLDQRGSYAARIGMWRVPTVLSATCALTHPSPGQPRFLRNKTGQAGPSGLPLHAVTDDGVCLRRLDPQPRYARRANGPLENPRN